MSKGGTRGSTEKAVIGQLGNYPRALLLAGLVMFVLALAPGLPFLPFAVLGSMLCFTSHAIPKRRAEVKAAEEAKISATPEYEQQMRYLKRRVLRELYFEKTLKAKIGEDEAKKVYSEKIAQLKP